MARGEYKDIVRQLADQIRSGAMLGKIMRLIPREIAEDEPGSLGEHRRSPAPRRGRWPC
jgi:hypothetical protein